MTEVQKHFKLINTGKELVKSKGMCDAYFALYYLQLNWP